VGLTQKHFNLLKTETNRLKFCMVCTQLSRFRSSKFQVAFHNASEKKKNTFTLAVCWNQCNV